MNWVCCCCFLVCFVFLAVPGNPIASAVQLPVARTGSWLLWTGDKTAGCASGYVGLFGTGRLVGATC